MQHELKELFVRYNLPDPNEVAVEIFVDFYEEVSEAIDAIDSQLNANQEPAPWQTPSEFNRWRDNAEKAKWIKTHQKELLSRFLNDNEEASMAIRNRKGNNIPKIDKPVKDVTDLHKSEASVPGTHVFKKKDIEMIQTHAAETPIADMLLDAYQSYVLRGYHVLKDMKEEVDLNDTEERYFRDLERFLIRNRLI